MFENKTYANSSINQVKVEDQSKKFEALRLEGEEQLIGALDGRMNLQSLYDASIRPQTTTSMYGAGAQVASTRELHSSQSGFEGISKSLAKLDLHS
jgi:hypothetical protein